ncbi:hypothetical protein LOZ61_003180 [Ophidiomyces ophidiicola]|nr:hypothetical protein LOZ61_003180 [Ophidiomyces ophidiicola]KAI1928235.1 hypothetical protein LOZ60_002549 [Ophidiomyces ophidiicola]KAI1973146.1 hypothetical protein LOZ56_001975 [Ophidiomyces ophidiicola]KAI2020871.1 hypothetical protein LOZ48_006501 [Ophidiomyces ophidiicola]KAI2027319.1 hypothetical protein LOZ45_002681 [Ophidiomyces ophidiicola]
MASNKTIVTDELVESLRLRLKTSELLSPASPAYEDAIKRWSAAAIKRAGMVLLAQNTADISQAVVFARETNIDLAIKGGGHSVAGASSSDGGLVIDLSHMRAVAVDPVQKTITAQGGALWADVDAAADKHQLATVGGTVNHTGIGGLTLGGGMGWLSGRYGLVVDNLLAVEIVLADGRVVRASATEEPELFWAVRGAGHNFGVVTEFVYRAYDQAGPVFAGALTFTLDKLEETVDVLNYLQANPDQDSGFGCLLNMPPGSDDLRMDMILFYNGTEQEALKRFEKLIALEPIAKNTFMMPYVVVNGMLNAGVEHGGRRTFKGVSFVPPLRPAFLRSLAQKFLQKFQDEPDMRGSVLMLEVFDMRKIQETKVTDTATPNRGSAVNGVLALHWNDSANDARYREWSREIQRDFEQEMERTQKDMTAADKAAARYLNYIEPGEIAVSSVYGVNTERVRRLKEQYDPGFIFGKTNPIDRKA